MGSLKLLAGGLVVLLSNSVFGSADCTENCVAKVVTDFSGKPPFKRRVVMVPAADIEQVKIVTSEEAELVEVRTVDFSGKPPFKRKTELLEKADLLEVEITSEEVSEKRRTKGTGNSILKRH